MNPCVSKTVSKRVLKCWFGPTRRFVLASSENGRYDVTKLRMAPVDSDPRLSSLLCVQQGFES
jgi:hypothetical protein